MRDATAGRIGGKTPILALLCCLALISIRDLSAAPAATALGDPSPPPGSDASALLSSGFSMTTYGGIEAGTAKEFVYDGSITESELDWNFSPLYVYGLRIDYASSGGFFATLSLKSGVPGKPAR